MTNIAAKPDQSLTEAEDKLLTPEGSAWLDANGGYQAVFNAIADAVEWKEHRSFGVSAFKLANALASRPRPAVDGGVREAIDRAARYLDQLGDNLLRNDADMMLDDCEDPKDVAEQLRSALALLPPPLEEDAGRGVEGEGLLARNLRQLISYARWQVTDGLSHHPTLPSAIAEAEAALATRSPSPPPGWIEMNDWAKDGELVDLFYPALGRKIDYAWDEVLGWSHRYVDDDGEDAVVTHPNAEPTHFFRPPASPGQRTRGGTSREDEDGGQPTGTGQSTTARRC